MDQRSNDTFGSGLEGNPSSSGATGTGHGSSAAGMETGAAPGANFGHAGGVEGTRSGSTASEEQLGGTIDEGSDFSRGIRAPRGDAREKMSDGITSARERAAELKGTVADKLEAGAAKLRKRSADAPAYAGVGATDVGSTSATHDIARVGDKVAGGMERSADWLRNNDLDTMRDSIEKEVKDNPGRSLLIAAVAGYLLGKAFRR